MPSLLRALPLAVVLTCAPFAPAAAAEPAAAPASPAAQAKAKPSPAPRHARPGRATASHRFKDVKHWVSVFDDPGRDAWQKPVELVQALRIEPGQAVADLGAGTGYFETHLAGAVGPQGVVYAVDVEPGLVGHIRDRADREGTPNVIPVLASLDNPRLPPGAIDHLLIVDTYHHIDRREVYFERLKAMLAPGARVTVVDFHKRPLPVGPPLDHKLAREQVLAEMQAAGYALEREVVDVVPHQYVLVFRLAGGSGDATTPGGP